MEYEDIVPEGLQDKTEAECQEIIQHWEQLHDFKQAILEGEIQEARDQLPEIEAELARFSRLIEPRESPPETGILLKGDKQYILCPRCGTFVQFTPKRITEVALELWEKPQADQNGEKYLIRSVTCPTCKWGLGVPEGN